MKGKRIIAMALAAALCLPLTGCGDKSAANGDDRPVLKVGFECMTAPITWTQLDDSNGAVPITGSNEYTYGFEVELMKQLCDKAGYRMEAYKIDWEGLLLGVQTGTIDCAISAISITDERKASMDFTDCYYRSQIVALVKKDSKYAGKTKLQDLSGASCTSMLNTLWYGIIDQIPNVDKMPAMDNVPAMIVSLQSGIVDMLLMDEPTALSAVAANPDLAMVKLAEGSGFRLSDEDTDLGIAVSKKRGDVKEKLNAALGQITEEEKEEMLRHAIEVQPVNQ
ncbi:transporter substrate-binding domain-containing protein [bacterium 210820-DFI.6.52]|nr:transporter substrate-binding domain-containing protein [bacterium 210820-DFI.6.52]